MSDWGNSAGGDSRARGWRAIVLGLLLATTAGGMVAEPAFAQAREQKRSFDIPAQSLTEALLIFGRQSGVQVTADATLTSGKSSSAVSGDLSSGQALSRLLSGTGLTFRFINSRAVRIEAAPVNADGSIQLGPVRVEGDTGRGGASVSASVTSDPVATEATGSYTIAAMNTATRLALSPRETPQSVTVITRQRIEDQGLTTLSDVVRATPGLFITRWGGERYRFNSRMFSLENLMIDGIPVQYEEAALSTGVLDMYDRVEVVRGAAGLTQGAGTPAGSINLVRKRPTKDVQAILTASAGSWNNYLGTMDVGGPVNNAGTLRTRAVVTYQDKDSFTVDYHNQRLSLYGIIEADLGSATTVSVGASYSREDNPGVDWNGIGTYPDGTALPISRSTRMSPSWSFWDRKSATYFAGLDHDFGSGWKGRLSAIVIDSSMDMQGTFLNSAFLTDGGAPRFTIRGGAYQYKRDQQSYDGYVSGPVPLFGRDHELVIGVSHRSRHNVGQGGGATVDGAFDIATIDPLSWDPRSLPVPVFGYYGLWKQDSKVSQTGAYGTFRANLSDALKIIAGGRLDWYKIDEAQYDGDWPYGISDFRIKGEFTPYLGTVYDIDKNLSLYASWTRIFNPQNNYAANGSLLAPQQGSNYEAGVKGEFLDGRLNASIALFQTDLRNLPMTLSLSECATGLTACYAPSGKVRSRGVELEVSGELAPGWQIGGGYTYNTAKHLSTSTYDPTGLYTDGNRYGTNIPRNMFKLSSTYTLPGALDRLTVGGQLRAQSRIYSASFGGYLEQKGFMTADISVRYALSDHASLTVNMNNVFDKYYYETVGSPTDSNFFGAPRNVLATLRYKM